MGIRVRRLSITPSVVAQTRPLTRHAARVDLSHKGRG